MTTRSLTAAQLDELATHLRERHEDVLRQLGSLDGSLAEVRTARGDGDTDDEHDPEGPTISSEWSRLAGSHDAIEVELALIATAMRRLDAGLYGACANCGKPIGVARLRARPEAVLCIDCARLAQS